MLEDLDLDLDLIFIIYKIKQSINDRGLQNVARRNDRVIVNNGINTLTTEKLVTNLDLDLTRDLRLFHLSVL